MASQIEEIIVTVSIDTECDHDPAWVRSKPLAFQSIIEGLPNRLQPVFMSVGAVPSYLLTVEVLEDADCVHTLKNLAGAHELGTHLHAEFVEPDKLHYDYAGKSSPNFQSSYPADIESRKMAALTELFKNRLGYSPRSFRAGRFGAGPNTIKCLQELGYLVDTSVTPSLRWTDPSSVIDFRKAPRQPYFPQPGSIIKPGEYQHNAVLEVPVTVRPRLLRRSPKWFRPWFASVEQMKDIVRYQMRQHADQRVLVLNMMFHSMEIIEKASPYPQSSSDVQRFLDDMHAALSWCQGEGARFASLAETHELFCPASSRH